MTALLMIPDLTHQEPSCAELCSVFNACFDHADIDPLDRARMLRGGDEPLYRPPEPSRPWGEIIYARELPASCLHEAAHWLHAGKRRRHLLDYGYWYLPDGRDATAQSRFEQHEAPIQAIEWHCALACGLPFRVSADNLVRPEPSAYFLAAITEEARHYAIDGLPARASLLTQALRAHWQMPKPCLDCFQVSSLMQVHT